MISFRGMLEKENQDLGFHLKNSEPSFTSSSLKQKESTTVYSILVKDFKPGCINFANWQIGVLIEDYF